MSFFHNKVNWRLGLATWLSRESKLQDNWMARLDFLSCNATTGMTVQLLCMLHSCASSDSLQAASHPRVPTSLHSFKHFFTLSHTLPLHDSHLNIGFLISKIQANLARNKANKMVDWIQPYNLPFWLFRDKTLKQTLDLICKLGAVEQNSLTLNSRICVALEP